MGEALHRKQVEQFENQRNARLQEASNNLLGPIPPGKEKVISAVTMGQAILAGSQASPRVSENGRLVEFLVEGAVCATTPVERFAQLGVAVDSCFCLATESDSQVVSMRVCAVDRRQVRPPTEEDF